MGFRDLALFNDSLLAKQAWQLLKNQDSLFHEVFKVRFFPNCIIMEAKKSRGGSYTWTSILHGRDVLSKGCRCRIGNGKTLGIWHNFWLPRQQAPQVLSPNIESLADTRVEILIDGEARPWNHNTVDGIFVQDEAELLKKLPLAKSKCEDSLV